jgi:hypothetical protein
MTFSVSADGFDGKKVLFSEMILQKKQNFIPGSGKAASGRTGSRR